MRVRVRFYLDFDIVWCIFGDYHYVQIMILV